MDYPVYCFGNEKANLEEKINYVPIQISNDITS